MSEVSRWLRWNVDSYDSDWLDNLDWPIRAVWSAFLPHVKVNGNNRGRCKALAPRVFARLHNIPTEYVQAFLNAALAEGAIANDGANWEVRNWAAYQSPDATRKRDQRGHSEQIADGRTMSGTRSECPGQLPDVPDHGVLSDKNDACPVACHATMTMTLTETLTETKKPKDPGAHNVSAEQILAADAVTIRRESNAAQLLRLLPETHRTPDVREWVGAYFKMRAEAKHGKLTDTVIDRRAAEYGSHSPEVIAQAFKEATLSQWKGVFPDKVRIDAPPGQSGHSGQRRPQETSRDKAARLKAERRARNAA